ncbi:O-antigen ligase family protein [Leisingera sp. SS27]|uniref:O-antigen ligase family protein n=1 Tax=Leisingera sp. SS27 TaxID=2979462 RepID=UPI00232C967F|nr:O-antigen ligase family protein [Leisingera sp. SS27]MDC0660382.1 O-antigen ligase family protein [Leisingera sp. SS27]
MPLSARRPRPGTAGAITLGHLEFALVAAAVMLAPVNYWRLGVAYFTLSDVFALCSFAVMLARGRLPLRPLGAAGGIWFGSVFLLLLGFLTGSVLNGDALDGAQGILQYSFSLLLLPMVLLRRTRQETVLLIKLLVLSLVLVMIHGAYYVHFHPDDWRFVSPNGRLKSVIERVNATGTLAALAILFTLWLRLAGAIGPALALLAWAVLGYGLLLTASNTGFFLAAAGLLVFALCLGAVRILAAVMLFAAVAGIAVYFWGELFLPEAFQQRVLGALRSGNLAEAGTFGDRLLLMQEAVRIADGTIWSGLGIDQYRMVSRFSAPVHNAYLLILAEGGLVSLLGLAGLLMTGVWLGWHERAHQHRALSPALTLATVLMLALALTGITHFYARFWLVPWLLALAASLSPDPARGGTAPD